MLLLMKQQGRRVLAARNVHRAFLNACVLLDIPVQWIYPRKSDGILSGTYDLADFEAALQAQTRPACVYVTSPDYLGRMADIAGLAELCHRYHAAFGGQCPRRSSGVFAVAVSPHSAGCGLLL